jgi:hypothetical protein
VADASVRVTVLVAVVSKVSPSLFCRGEVYLALSLTEIVKPEEYESCTRARHASPLHYLASYDGTYLAHSSRVKPSGSDEMPYLAKYSHTRFTSRTSRV